MCARFTVLSDAPIAAAIEGCVIPLSRNNTIWMRWRCAAGIFHHRSAVFSRRISALLHLTICLPESGQMGKRTTPRCRKTGLNQPRCLTYAKPRFKPLWKWISTQAAGSAPTINARDRIGGGPWQNFKSEVIAQNIEDLHSDNNK